MKNVMLVAGLLVASVVSSAAFADITKADLSKVGAKIKTTAKKAAVVEMTVNVDPAASSLTWTGKKVTGEHTGKIAVKGGSFKVKGDMSVLKGNIIADMKSITNDDIKDAEYNKKLVGHLASDDFFNSEKFPTAELKITKLVIGQTFAPGTPNADAEGTITIKGKTQPVKFKATFVPNPKDSSFEATGSLNIDRTQFGIKYGSGKFFENLGDKMINDEFKVDFKIVAKK